ncbi:MAG: leucine-rich repeat protein [Clostridium sp.]|nr:leucine-rich repeat protein [Clostridium sp.]
MHILYEETEGGIRVHRCFGKGGRAIIPEQIRGKNVTELGDYVFSDGLRCLPAGRWWNDEEMADTYAGTDRDSQNAGQLPPLCGLAVRTVSLPKTIRRIGRYAFYNCYDLQHLALSSGVRDVGAGAFTGCRNLTQLTIEVTGGERSCFKEVLAELSQELVAQYLHMERGSDGQLYPAGEARLLFPAYYEEAVENTPARILETHVHGCGHRYRYAFDGTAFLFREYDRLFPWLLAQDTAQSAALLAIGRLRYPLFLEDEARSAYADYLAGHLEETAACLFKENDMDAWKWLVSELFVEKPKEKNRKVERAAANCLGNEVFAERAHEEYFDIWKPVLGKTGLGKLIELSNQAGQTEVVSFLMDTSYQLFPPARRRFELE